MTDLLIMFLVYDSIRLAAIFIRYHSIKKGAFTTAKSILTRAIQCFFTTLTGPVQQSSSFPSVPALINGSGKPQGKKA